MPAPAIGQENRGGPGGTSPGGPQEPAEPVESATRPPRARCTAPCPCAHRTARPVFSRPANCHCERLLSCAWRSPYHVCTWMYHPRIHKVCICVGNGRPDGEQEIQSVTLMSRGGIALSMKSQAPATTKAVKLALPKHQPCQNFRRFRRAPRSLRPDVGNGGNLAKARDLPQEKAVHLLGRGGGGWGGSCAGGRGVCPPPRPASARARKTRSSCTARTRRNPSRAPSARRAGPGCASRPRPPAPAACRP